MPEKSQDDRYFERFFKQVMDDIEYQEYLIHQERCPVCGKWWEDGHTEECPYTKGVSDAVLH